MKNPTSRQTDQILNKGWWIFRGEHVEHNGIERLPAPPRWRDFQDPLEGRDVPSGWRSTDYERARAFQCTESTIEAINAALFLRRPLMVTGKPGIGKSTLAYAVAYELGLGQVLRWPITSRSMLRDGLYSYDAVGRLRDSDRRQADPGIAGYIKLGPLGTALAPTDRPRVLLIDEIDKSDLDFPNDLLTVFEEGIFEIPELVRTAKTEPEVRVSGSDGGEVLVREGRVQCAQFPFVVLTDNQEREFPPAFLRRCIPVRIDPLERPELEKIVEDLLGPQATGIAADLIEKFLDRQREGHLATDQLLNAIFLTYHSAQVGGRTKYDFAELLMGYLQKAPP